MDLPKAIEFASWDVQAPFGRALWRAGAITLGEAGDGLYHLVKSLKLYTSHRSKHIAFLNRVVQKEVVTSLITSGGDDAFLPHAGLPSCNNAKTTPAPIVQLHLEKQNTS